MTTFEQAIDTEDQEAFAAFTMLADVGRETVDFDEAAEAPGIRDTGQFSISLYRSKAIKARALEIREAAAWRYAA